MLVPEPLNGCPINFDVTIIIKGGRMREVGYVDTFSTTHRSRNTTSVQLLD